MGLRRFVLKCTAAPVQMMGAGARTAAGIATAGAGMVTAPVRDLPVVPAMHVVADAVGELFGGAAARRCARDGRWCWIEVRGLRDDGPGEQVGASVLAALRAHPGVTRAALNCPLSRVIVETSGGTSLTELCVVVEAAEAAVGPAAADSTPRTPPVDLPIDPVALAGSAVAAVASGVGLGISLVGRLAYLPRMPLLLSAIVNVVDYQPRVRRSVEERLGAPAADTLIALAAATAYTLTLAPASLATDLLVHLAKAAEMQANAQSWRRRAPDLSCNAECADGVWPRPRPGGMPSGPVERYGDRAGAAQVFGALALGALTANVSSVATAAVVATPKAARTCRESFAAALGRGLAERYGVLIINPRALRRLDRVDAVLVDPRVLCGDGLRVGAIRGVRDQDRAAVWQWAQDELACGAMQSGWHPVALNGRSGDGDVLILPERDPLAPAVLAEIRRAGATAVSVRVDSLDDLGSSFDTLDPVENSVDGALAAAVQRLQRDGRTVAVVTSAAAQALADADVAIGIMAQGRPAWHADVLTDGLDAVWAILHALPTARKASARGVEIAAGASALGALLMIPGVRGVGPGPVTAGAAAGLWTGYRLAQRVMDAAPPPVFVHEWHAMSAERVRLMLPPQAAPHERASPRSRIWSYGNRSVGAAQSMVSPVAGIAWEYVNLMRSELSDPLTPVLAVGAAASAALGSPVDAILVGSVLGGNAALAAAQQLRAERLLRRLLVHQDPMACKLVDDGEITVAATELRPGDVIVVRAGEVVPADARLIDVADVEVDESALTGESLPVAKQVEATPAVPVAERACMLYEQTTVVAGTATAIVTEVGARTQARRAAVATTRGPAVGLQSQLRDLTAKALPFSLAGGALVSLLGLLRMTGLRQAVSSGVAVSVAAVPEGLPLVATLAQQASARRLTRSGVLVRAPRSVEALGRVDVVCFDKTGTLTENRLRVARVHAAAGLAEADVLGHAVVAAPDPRDGVSVHATDTAIAEAGPVVAAAGPDGIHLPFRSGRPFSASIRDGELSIKGAPEVVLAACDSPVSVHRRVEEMAADGLRVIAVARRPISVQLTRAAAADQDAFAELCSEKMQFAGLLGLSDTPRADAADVLAELGARGIGVRLITGDHPVTAAAVATELGMPFALDQVISGPEWDALSRGQQEEAALERLVFARMSPENKVQVVETLQRIGQVCAMVGDGANDAAAIRVASVGIGVAARGSDPARTAADVMLLDGRIRSLLDAVDEGRQLWRRVQAAVSVLLGGNAGEVAFAVTGTALTGRSPLNTRQLLLVNMLTDALPAAALAVSPPRADFRYLGRGPDQAALWRAVAVRGTTTAGAATAAWTMALLTGRPRRASTVALVALVSTQLGQTLIDSRSPLVVGTAAGSLFALGAVISTPVVSQLLGSTPLGPVGWGQALSTAAVATGVAAAAPRVIRWWTDQSSMWMTPRRNNTAYSSRNGTASNSAATTTGSVDPLVVLIPDIVNSSGVDTQNTP